MLQIELFPQIVTPPPNPMPAPVQLPGMPRNQPCFCGYQSKSSEVPHAIAVTDRATAARPDDHPDDIQTTKTPVQQTTR
jgi:hypothetical protein